MNRNKIIEVVAETTADEEVAKKFAEHLEELFKNLEPNRICKEYE